MAAAIHAALDECFIVLPAAVDYFFCSGAFSGVFAEPFDKDL
jgi:hypothetical protein